MPGLTKRAQDLRKNPAHTERILWERLRRRQVGGYKFRRQMPIENYIVDFVCMERRLIVELDGFYHQEQRNYDENRTTILESKGFKVIRFENDEVIDNFEYVIERIEKELDLVKT